MKFLEDQCNAKDLSPLTLAFVGDGVFEILVRERLVCQANRSVNHLHSLAVSHVKASAQKKAFEKMENVLSQNEMDIFKRGRNAKSNTTPKNASEQDYHYATGFECLVGYLYLDNKTDRLLELFDLIWED